MKVPSHLRWQYKSGRAAMSIFMGSSLTTVLQALGHGGGLRDRGQIGTGAEVAVSGASDKADILRL